MPKTKVAAGGGANVNGVLYQMLWSLFRVSKIGILGYEPNDPGSSVNATVVLEPLDGGDLRIDGDHQVIEQLKARSDRSGWSLQEVIKKVLPDLFLGVSSDPERVQTFRFVTEGGIGDWQAIYTNFFQDLKNRERSSFLDVLDDSIELSTGARQSSDLSSFFPSPCTERSLFTAICDHIASKHATKKLSLSQHELQQRVWRLLEQFEFRGHTSFDQIQNQVDSFLLAVADKDCDIPRIRDHLAVELAKLATSGNAIVVAEEFLNEHRIDSIPLTNWSAHRERAHEWIRRTLRRRKYDPLLDIPTTTDAHRPHVCVHVLTGESGCGKSWTMNRLAEQSVIEKNLPVLIESTGDADRDLQKAADIFWHQIHDGDESLAFSRIEKRLRKVLKDRTDVGLTVFVDGVKSFQQAKGLLDYDWQSGRSRLVMACSQQVAESLNQAFPGSIDVSYVGRFTLPQLHDYLHRRVGDSWATIPEDVRSTILTPMLASFFCDLFGETSFRPESEYQLFDRVFRNRVSGNLTGTPLDEASIESLATNVRNGGQYPWSKRQLLESGMDDARIQRLISNGWLVQPDADSYRVFHDRLLNWSVASALERDLYNGNISREDFVDQAVEAFKYRPERPVYLGYVAMDTLWLLCKKQSAESGLACRILKGLEDSRCCQIEDLYELAATLGEGISEALFARYKEFANTFWPANVVMRALRSTAGLNLNAFVEQLITSEEPMQQRKGINLASRSSFPGLVEEFWRIHNAANDDPEKFGQEERRRVLLYNETFQPLKQSALSNLKWLDEKISQIETDIEQLNDLTWIIANADDSGKLWQKHKLRLIQQLGDSHPRSLIACINRFRDEDEIAQLEQWTKGSDDIVQAVAIQAMSRMDTGKATSLLCKTDPRLMTWCKHWCFQEIFERDQSGTSETTTIWMKSANDPWDIGFLYAGRENDLTVAHLEILLDNLESRLRNRAFETIGTDFSREFSFLGRVSDIALIEHIRNRADSDLEFEIEKFLTDLGPHQGVFATVTGRKGALMTLQLMESSALTRVVNKYLKEEDQFGLNETIQWSVKSPDEETFRLLVMQVNSDIGWPGHMSVPQDRFIPINQNEALCVLASHRRWIDVANGARKLAPNVDSDLEFPENPIENEWVFELRKEVSVAPTIGSVTALGIVGGPEDGRIILKVLEECDRNSKLAFHCLIAIRECEFFNEEAVERVNEHLQIENHRHLVTQYLNRAGASGVESAWDALLADLEQNFDHINALNLINLSKHATSAIEITLSKLPDFRGFAEFQMLEILLTEINNADHQRRLLENEYVQSFLHSEAAKSEGRSWHTGSKERMIRCLALLNKELAFSACLRCVRNTDAKDRTRYPFLLMEIDFESAQSALIEFIVQEKSVLMKNAILRALEGQELSKYFEDWITSEVEEYRKAACELYGIGANADESRKALASMLNDESDDVISAAVLGLQKLRDRQVQTELVNAIKSEQTRKRRVAMIDAFVNTCSPGEEHEPITPFIRSALESLSLFEWKNAVKRIKKRGKKRDDALMRSDKREKFKS